VFDGGFVWRYPQYDKPGEFTAAALGRYAGDWGEGNDLAALRFPPVASR
jgi:hypothetical protein